MGHREPPSKILHKCAKPPLSNVNGGKKSSDSLCSFLCTRWLSLLSTRLADGLGGGTPLPAGRIHPKIGSPAVAFAALDMHLCWGYFTLNWRVRQRVPTPEGRIYGLFMFSSSSKPQANAPTVPRSPHGCPDPHRFHQHRFRLLFFQQFLHIRGQPRTAHDAVNR